MKLKKWAPLLLAVVLGLVAAKVARDAVIRNRSAAAAGSKTVRVVVAKTNIAPGQLLTPEVLVLAPIAADTIPAGAFKDPAELSGRVARTSLFTGQPVMQGVLASKDAGSGLQALVPTGMRAITVQVDEISGVAGLLVPGCHVDIVATVTGTNADTTSARTIVQNVLVTAVGQRLTAAKPETDKPGDFARSVTIIATPHDVEAIELASTNSRPRLVLRGSRDGGVAESDGVTLAQLRGRNQRSADPFAVNAQPTVIQQQAPAAPKTTDAGKPGEAASVSEYPQHWHVTLLNAGSSSELVFELPRSTVTSTDIERAIPSATGN